MKTLKIFNITAVICFAFISSSSAYWWLPPTICKLDNTKCYSGITAGIDYELWDKGAKCWGQKYICPDALTKYYREPIALTKEHLKDKSNFNSDYDINLYSASDDCYGIRRINKDGNQVYVDGRYVNIWCSGILDNPDEIVANGEIVYGTQPTCETLKKDGYAAVNTGRCFGKYFDESQYYIECGSELLPSRMIVLNGAYYGIYKQDFPTIQSDADYVFDVMYQNSLDQKSNYFN